MTSAAALSGWVMAAIIAVLTLAVRRAASIRMEAVARACHELRGPITAARLGLSLGERSGELSPSRLRAIDTELGRATLALRDLADLGRATLALHDLADLGQGGPRLGQLERIGVRAVMVDCARAADGLAARFGSRIEAAWEGPDAVVWGDRLRLAQAIGNLIANAIEHGGGRVFVRGVVDATAVRIEVCDEGPGLPEPVAALIRRPRCGRGARGRGLAIAAAVAAAHGGRVAAAPAADGGRVVLELARPPEPEPAPATPRSRP